MKSKFRQLYDLVPFKQQIFTLIKSVWTPNEKIYRYLHFVGLIKVKLHDGKHFKMHHYGYQIENEMFWRGVTGGWEKESLKIWIKLCATSTNIIDIGANTGIYSIIAKAVNPASVVYAFEPVNRVFKKLQNNISLNNFDIIAYEKAMSNFDGEAIIYDQFIEHVYSVTVNKNMASPDIPVLETKISAITLDTFIKQNNISSIDLIKIDVETHEPEVLEGFSQNMLDFKPTILIEILTDEVGQRVQDLVKDVGYLYFNIDENGGIRQVASLTKSDYYNYLLCSQPVAEYLGLIHEK